MLKIFDCSNSNERPKHREVSLCPKENSIVSDLKRFSKYFNAKWITNINKADVLFTNDVFPKKYHKLSIRKIKRMDGVFQLNSLKKRNEKLNESAKIADHVIFISNFSKKSYYKLYGNKIKKDSVILNTVDNNIFYKTIQPKGTLIFSASCSNWERDEKRFRDLFKFSELIRFKIYLIGKNKLYSVSNNIIPFGYINNDYHINKILNMSNAFINLSYKDACPKTVSQAIACGLPVLYANSGGVPEQVKSGVSIKDKNTIKFDDLIPELKMKDLSESYIKFLKIFDVLKEKAENNIPNHLETMTKYYKILGE